MLGVVPQPVRWMHAFVDVPAEHAASTRGFWSAVTGWPVGDPWPGHAEFASLAPPDGAPYLHLQTISGPPRVHLDLVGDPDRDAVRLEELGATCGPRHDAWQVMSSPAGLPFCICDEQWPHQRPGATSWPTGTAAGSCSCASMCRPSTTTRSSRSGARPRAGSRSRSTRPSSTGWCTVPRARCSCSSSGSVATTARRGPARTLDLGSGDVGAEVARVEALGARVLRPGGGFVALVDPVGLPFCVTANAPDR